MISSRKIKATLNLKSYLSKCPFFTSAIKVQQCFNFKHQLPKLLRSGHVYEYKVHEFAMSSFSSMGKKFILNAHKAFRSCPGRLLKIYVLSIYVLCPGAVMLQLLTIV